MSAASDVLGVDFGTSNSACGIAIDGTPHLIEIDAGERTLPTAVFFDFDAQRVTFGHPANAALIEGATGRYMRGLKSLLGAALMREQRRLLGERLDFIDITARFLAHLKARAEAATGRAFTRALSGRPVVFHPDVARNAQALADLTEAYARAGFASVRFLPEPEAAARAYSHVLAPGQTGMVVDIGGGTSDYTVLRIGPDGPQILGNHGIRLGGTDLDRTLSIAHVMPLVGRGARIRYAFGDETHTAPNAIFNDLATWAKIPFLYSAETRRVAKDLARNAVEPQRLNRLVSVLAEETGHDIAFAVEAGKIAANTAPEANIDLTCIERGLSQPLSQATLSDTLSEAATAIGDAALDAAKVTNTAPEDIDALILVGGTSLMHLVSDGLKSRFPGASQHRGAALTAVADGLALAASDPWPPSA